MHKTCVAKIISGGKNKKLEKGTQRHSKSIAHIFAFLLATPSSESIAGNNCTDYRRN